MAKRTIVITDIHGCARTFNRLLEILEVRQDDTVYLLGDYIDRGPDSKGVIDTIRARQSAGFDFLPLLGNHEDLLLQAHRSGVYDDYVDWLDNGGNATLKSFGVEHLQDLPETLISFLTRLPLYRMTETHLFVHAGLNSFLADPLSREGREAMLWQRSAVVNQDRICGRVLISGHTTKSLAEIRESLASEHIQLDNGCVYARETTPATRGNLVALILETGKLVVQRNCE